jgi:hypothetical protein
MPEPTQTPSKSHINPWVSIFILLIVALGAWALVAQKAKIPATPGTENQAPRTPSLTPPGEEEAQTEGEAPALVGTVTFIQGASLTILATVEDNPRFTAKRILIAALHNESKVTDRNGNTLSAQTIKAGDRIAVYSSMKLTNEEPILAADKVVVNP